MKNSSVSSRRTSRRSVLSRGRPTEFYGHLGLPANKSPVVRQSAAPAVRAAAGRLRLPLSSEVEGQIDRGFMNDDAYDAFVGLLGMINVLLGNRPASPELDRDVARIEGWIFGQGD